MSDELPKTPPQTPPSPDSGQPGPRLPGRGLLALILLGPRSWKRWWAALVRSVSHDEILEQVDRDAGVSFNYAFMVAIAAGIATVGLLFGSPAVIIGAMLISPLMGPIVGVGFALARLDVSLGRRGAWALLCGAGIAVACAAAIVATSPIREITPEILARTRPNLFDLLVAVLSGAAGGYGMIRGRGGAIVGVAIATALMPPLATIGYGLATLQWGLARGALLLFVTNMIAIALSVATLAAWYGFGRGSLQKLFARQAVISLIVLAPLVVPLFVSLKDIAWEARVNATAREVLDTHARALPDGQLARLHVTLNYGEPPVVEALVIADRTEPGLSTRVSRQLEQTLGVPVRLHLTLIRAEDPRRTPIPVTQESVPAQPPAPEPDPADTLRAELPFALNALDVNAADRRITLAPRFDAGVDLAAWQRLEAMLTARHPGWQLQLIPPATGLPRIVFAPGSATLDASAEQTLALTLWALQRWQQPSVELVGHASSPGGGTPALARARAASVAGWLILHGIDATSHAAYPYAGQAALEREQGRAAFRSVDISLTAPPPA